MYYYKKTSEEIKTIAIDFSQFLVSSNIVSYLVTITDQLGNDVTSSVLFSSSQNGSQILVALQGGTTGDIYIVTLIVRTDLNNVYEEDITLLVAQYDILGDAKSALRISVLDTSYDEEIYDLINACKIELTDLGITFTITDPLIKRTLITYCKAYFGYDNDNAQGFINSYEKLKIYLMNSSTYNMGENNC